jgi:hypothetical protein
LEARTSGRWAFGNRRADKHILRPSGAAGDFVTFSTGFGRWGDLHPWLRPVAPLGRTDACINARRASEAAQKRIIMAPESEHAIEALRPLSSAYVRF